MRMLYALVLCLAARSFAAPAMADPPDPPDLTDTVAQAMQQATAITEATRADAAKTGERLAQAPTQALYARYHPPGAAAGQTPAKPCAQPRVLETGGLCIPAPAVQ
jgi:hypothetical protein